MTKESAGEKKWDKHRSHSAFGRNRNRNWDRNQKKPNPPDNANTKPQTPPTTASTNTTGYGNRGANGHNGAGGNNRSSVSCFFCKKPGHVKADCYGFKNWLAKQSSSNSEKMDAVSNINVVSEVSALQSIDMAVCKNKNSNTHPNPFVQRATIGSVSVDVLRDTGADISLIKSTLVGDREYTGSYIYVKPILSSEVSKLPLAKVAIKSLSVSGLLCFAVADADKIDYDVIIGNDHGIEQTVSVGAVTRLKTGTFIKRPVRYDDDNEVPVVIDNKVVTDDHVDNVVTDNHSGNIDTDRDVDINVDSSDVHADPMLIDGIDTMGSDMYTTANDTTDHGDCLEQRLS
jgi:hypothetical protein